MYTSVLPVCIYVHNMPMLPIVARRGVRSSWNWSFRWLWAVKWVLGTKSWSFVRAASVLNLWTISPAHPFNVCWCVSVLCVYVYSFAWELVYVSMVHVCGDYLGCQSLSFTSFESLYLGHHFINQTSWSISFQDFSFSASHLAIGKMGWRMNPTS